jgi:hypothetical protein
VPELPEAEAIVRGLRSTVVGERIRRTRVLHADVLRQPRRTFGPHLRGRQIVAVQRRGKNVIHRLDDDSVLAVNLGMTGRLLPFSKPPRGAARPTHAAVRFSFGSGGTLIFDDQRRFGTVEHLTVAGPAPYCRSGKHLCRGGPAPGGGTSAPPGQRGHRIGGPAIARGPEAGPAGRHRPRRHHHSGLPGCRGESWESRPLAPRVWPRGAALSRLRRQRRPRRALASVGLLLPRLPAASPEVQCVGA